VSHQLAVMLYAYKSLYTLCMPCVIQLTRQARVLAFNFGDSGQFKSILDFKARRDLMQDATPQQLLAQAQDRQPLGTPESAPAKKVRTRLDYDQEEDDEMPERPAKRAKLDIAVAPPAPLAVDRAADVEGLLADAYAERDEAIAERNHAIVARDEVIKQLERESQEKAGLLALFKAPSMIDPASHGEKPDIIALMPTKHAISITYSVVPNDATKVKMTIERLAPTADQLASIPEAGPRVAQVYNYATSKAARDAINHKYELLLPTVEDYVCVRAMQDAPAGLPYRAFIYSATQGNL